MDNYRLISRMTNDHTGPPLDHWSFWPSPPLSGSLLLANLYGLVASIISSGAILFEFPELLILARMVASSSATVGLLALVLFLQEVPCPSQRGLFCFLCALSVSVVECFALCLNLALPRLGEHLLVLVSVPILPQLVGLLVALRLKESPQFLAQLAPNNKQQQYTEKAMKAMAFYRKGILADIDVHRELAKVMGESGQLQKHSARLFKGHRWRAALLGFCTLQITVGGWPVLESSAEILSEHFGQSVVEITSFVLVIAYFLSSLTGLFFIERLNRRLLVLRSALLNGLALCLYIASHWSAAHLAPWTGWFCLPCILLFSISLGFALGPISYFLCAELLPLPCAASSWLISMVFAANIIGTFLFDWATPPLFRKASAWAFFPLYLLPAALCLVPLWLYLPETRGRSKAQIVAQMEGKGRSGGENDQDEQQRVVIRH